MVISVHPVQESEKATVTRVMDRAFSKDPMKIQHQGFWRQFNYISLRCPEFFWGVFADEVPVAGLLLVPYQIQISHACFQVCGLTGVGTDQKFRRMGYSNLLLQNVHKYLKEIGIDGTILHSAADELYIKNGYELTFGDWVGSLELTMVARKKFKDIIEKAQVDQSKRYVQFYVSSELSENLTKELFAIQQRSAQFTHRFVRVPKSWNYFHHKLSEHLENRVSLGVLYEDKVATGYFLARTEPQLISFFDQYLLHEIKSNYAIMWNAFLEQTGNPKEIQVKAYYEDLILSEFVQDLGGKWHWNLLTVNLAQFFNPLIVLQKMQSDLSIRLEDSKFYDLDKKIILTIESQPFELELHRGVVMIHPPREILNPTTMDKILNVQITSRQFTAIVLGFISVDEIIDLQGQDIESEQIELLKVLFPELHPIWDRFDNY
jgi:predicted acetyltransferase